MPAPGANWPAPNFEPDELRCKGCLGRPCGRDPHGIQLGAVDALQALRERLDRAMPVLSAYRCPFHNARVGGAPLSRHKMGDAFDIRTTGWPSGERERLVGLARSLGWGGVGLYRTFVHLDLGKRRSWSP